MTPTYHPKCPHSQSERLTERINEPPWGRCLQGAVDVRWVVVVVVVVVASSSLSQWGRSKAIQGDPGRSRAIQGDPGRSGAIQGDPGRSRAIRGDPGRSGAIQGDPGSIRRHLFDFFPTLVLTFFDHPGIIRGPSGDHPGTFVRLF